MKSDLQTCSIIKGHIICQEYSELILYSRGKKKHQIINYKINNHIIA
jgi:hypothetical protein